MHLKVLAWPRIYKRLVVVAVDITLAFIATWLAFSLRLDVMHRPVGLQWMVYFLTPLLAVPVFVKFGLYRAIFRYTGQAALISTVQAIAVYGLGLFAILLWMQWPTVPRSVGVRGGRPGSRLAALQEMNPTPIASHSGVQCILCGSFQFRAQHARPTNRCLCYFPFCISTKQSLQKQDRTFCLNFLTQ